MVLLQAGLQIPLLLLISGVSHPRQLTRDVNPDPLVCHTFVSVQGYPDGRALGNDLSAKK